MERVKQNTDPAWFSGGVPAPLAPLAELAGATVSDTGSIDQSQAAISLVALLCGMKCLPGRTTQRAIGL